MPAEPGESCSMYMSSEHYRVAVRWLQQQGACPMQIQGQPGAPGYVTIPGIGDVFIPGEQQGCSSALHVCLLRRFAWLPGKNLWAQAIAPRAYSTHFILLCHLL